MLSSTYTRGGVFSTSLGGTPCFLEGAHYFYTRPTTTTTFIIIALCLCVCLTTQNQQLPAQSPTRSLISFLSPPPLLSCLICRQIFSIGLWKLVQGATHFRKTLGGGVNPKLLRSKYSLSKWVKPLWPLRSTSQRSLPLLLESLGLSRFLNYKETQIIYLFY